jgi:hypothetical protein
MPTHKYRIQETLYKSFLFADLEDAELDSLADELKLYFPQVGERVIEQGEKADRFYLIHRGGVDLVWNDGSQESMIASLEAGDYFGEEGLLNSGGKYHASAVAVPVTALIEITRDHFKRLSKKYPQIRRTLEMVATTQDLTQKLNLKWLGEEEQVYLVAHRHIFILLLRMLGPLVFWLIALLFGAWGWVTVLSLPEVMAAILFGIGLLWGIWIYLDWRNDYYILTNDRIVWLEQVIGLYENRQESPLYAVLSTDLQTTFWGRILGYGDIKVKTFTGLITLDSVANPQHIIDMINEHRERSIAEQRLVAHVEIRETVRQRINLEHRPPPSLPKRTWRKTKATKPQRAHFWQDFLDMRIQEGNTITYRKHWIILIYSTWLPVLVAVGIGFVSLSGLFSWPISLMMLMIPAVWWAYQYADWRNDIFQVTNDKIFDIDRKPLGDENKKEGALENILSLEVERKGILGILLNYGNVIIDVSGTKFIFDDIFNPSEAQQDIFRRIDTLKRKKQEDEARKEREQLGEWIEVYDDESNNPYNWT